MKIAILVTAAVAAKLIRDPSSKSHKPALWLFTSPDCGKKCSEAEKAFQQAESDLNNIVRFYHYDQAADTDVPLIRWQKGGEKYKGKINATEIARFAAEQTVKLLRLKVPDTARTSEKRSSESKTKNIKKGSVITLTQASFDTELMKDTENVWFVKFYAPWCGHCKALEPAWIELAAKLEGKVKVAKVDATTETQLAQRFQVQGFPTLLLFPAGKKSTGKAVPYQGGRDVASMMQFGLKHAAGSLKPVQLTSQDQFDTACSDSLCLVAFLPHILDSNAKERIGYLKVMKNTMAQATGIPIKFLWAEASNSRDLEDSLRLGFGWPAVVLINAGKKSFATHRGRFTASELNDFITKASIGRISGEPLPEILKWPRTNKWDGKDAKIEL